MAEPFDRIVIGSGPGGQRAAIRAAKPGKRAAVVERKKALGGAALHAGTLDVRRIGTSAPETIHLGRMAIAHDRTVDDPPVSVFDDPVFDDPALAEARRVAAHGANSKLALRRSARARSA